MNKQHVSRQQHVGVITSDRYTQFLLRCCFLNATTDIHFWSNQAGLDTFHKDNGRPPDLLMADLDTIPDYQLDAVLNRQPNYSTLLLTGRTDWNWKYALLPVSPSLFLAKHASPAYIQYRIESILARQLRSTRPLTPLPEPHSPRKHVGNEKILVKSNASYKEISPSSISFIHAEKDVSHFWMRNESFPTLHNLDRLEEVLFPNLIRVHPTLLVNFNHVTEVHPSLSIITVNDTFVLPVTEKAELFDCKHSAG